jgi:hypothetical protein
MPSVKNIKKDNVLFAFTMTEVSSNNFIPDQFLDAESSDFAELSNLLGDDFSNERTSAVGLESQMQSSSNEMRYGAALPEFNIASPPKETQGDDFSSTRVNDAMMLEPARVSPTPSAMISMANNDNDSMPLVPNVQEALPDKVGSVAKTKKSHPASRKRKTPDAGDKSSSDEPPVNPSSKQKNRRR